MEVMKVKRLRELREQRRWSQMELSRQSGVSQSFINYLEAGLKQPTLTTMNKLASAFGVSIAELLDSNEQSA
jgi:transcriptional regulator with XRE-family HTH domain